jgi:uncharacterized protein YdiU (UPF0061 family)
MVNEITSYGEQEINQCKYLSAQAQQEYEQMMNELKDNYLSYMQEHEEEYQKLYNQLQEAALKATAIIEANKRSTLDKEAKDFYRLQLSNIDIEEIKKIRSIEPYLRKKEPLNKVIWKVYYEKPFTDMIGRVVGPAVKSGIYKITNMENGMVYVG